MKKYYPLTFILSLLVSTLSAQSPPFNAIYWGTYLKDNIDFPSFNYSTTDLIDQVAVDPKNANNIFVVGQSFAPPKTTITVCSGSQSIKLGSGDGYLAKLDQCGQVIWSTFIGDYVQCLKLDVQNGKTIIYVAGNITNQNNNAPKAFKCDASSSGIFQINNADHTDAFLAKYEDDDTTVALLRWTYFGGINVNSITGSEDILSLDVYKHNVFAVGTTTSTNLSDNALKKGDSTYSGGGGDGFIAEFDSMLSTMNFFTYVGGNGNDRFHDVKIFEEAANTIAVYASGTTNGSIQIASGTGFDQSANGNDDAFLQKWEDNDHDGLFTKTWGTYIGGTDGEHSRSMAVDKNGNVFLTGYTQSTNMPITSMAYDQIFGADGTPSTAADAYVIKVNSSGGNEWCTYFGGKKDETANGLTIFKKQGVQYVAIAGLTKAPSSFFPLVNSFQDKLNGNNSNQYYDAYLAIFNDVSGVQQQLIQSTYLGGSNAEGVQTGVSYHPSIAVGTNKEIYLVMATMSSDINTIVGGEFQHLIQPYIGGFDAFIAKIVDTTNASQTGCTYFNLNKIKNTLEESDFAVYPNPVHDQITLSIITDKEENATIEVFNSCQKLFTIQTVSLTTGQNLIILNLEQLSPGIYFLRLKKGDDVIMKKIVKN